MPAQRRAGTSLFVSLRLHRGVLTARLVGPSLALRESQIIANAIREQIEAGDPLARVILDLEDVTYINSAGLGALLQIQAAAAAHATAVELRNVPPSIRQVLRMVGLDRVLVRGDRRHRRARRRSR